MDKDQGRIVSGGMGGLLNPPTHPEHTVNVAYRRKHERKDSGSMSLSYAVECDYLDDATRAAAKRRLDSWVPPPLESAAIQEWIHQVLGYFRGSYKGVGPDETCWNAGNLHFYKDGEELPAVDDHAGVHLIRKYYPDFTPTSADFELAYWGTKPDRG